MASAGNGTALTPAVSIGQQTVTIQISTVYQILPSALALGSAAAPTASYGTAGR